MSKKLYLDLCSFNRPYDDQLVDVIRLESEAKLTIQERIERGEHELIWSFILTYENSKNPDLNTLEAIENWKNLAAMVIEYSTDVVEQGQALSRLGLDPKDALHVSSAILAGADYFITTDKGILKRRSIIDQINILNPVEFLLQEDK